MVKRKKKEKDKDVPVDDVPPPSPGMFRALRRQIYRPLLIVPIVTVAAVAFGWPVLKRFLPPLDHRREYRLRATQIRITQPPHWVPHNLVEQIVEHAALPAELSILDEHLTRDVAEAFALHPWIEKVVSVEKSFPATVDVQLEYRRPVAMVQVKQGLYPVDVRGVLLPPHDFSPSEAKSYPQIAEVLSTPQGPAGASWGDPVVVEAAALAAELAPLWKKLQLAAIVCPRTPRKDDSLDSGVYMLTTSGGSQIVWGHPPGSDHPGELTTAQKIERLEKYAAQFGGLDQPQQRFRIDIRHWRNIGRIPISAERETPDDAQR